jgi:hypothetical protein
VTPRASHWAESWRADPQARVLADRHYNRQRVGAAQFVPPGRCVVLLATSERAAWVTSWPLAEFTKHAWAGAWVNSLFRNEARDLHRSSDLIVEAVAVTRHVFGEPPALGMVTFVDADAVRRKRDPGRCYLRAGFVHVGFTEGGLWAFQMLPAAMPAPLAPALASGPLFARGAA